MEPEPARVTVLPVTDTVIETGRRWTAVALWELVPETGGPKVAAVTLLASTYGAAVGAVRVVDRQA